MEAAYRANREDAHGRLHASDHREVAARRLADRLLRKLEDVGLEVRILDRRP